MGNERGASETPKARDVVMQPRLCAKAVAVLLLLMGLFGLALILYDTIVFERTQKQWTLGDLYDFASVLSYAIAGSVLWYVCSTSRS